MKYNINELLELASKSETPVIKSTASNGRYSFSVVNSESNGKRISISKALAEALDLEDSVSLLPIQEEGLLMLSKKPLSAKASSGRLKERGKKLCYNASLVRLITDAFRLDFSNHVSLSFSDISIEDHEGEPVAVVVMQKDRGEEKGEQSA